MVVVMGVVSILMRWGLKRRTESSLMVGGWREER